MNELLRAHAERIIRAAITQVLPNIAVTQALSGVKFPGRVFVVAVGKAAWQMARSAADCMADKITAGVVITKYEHVREQIPGIKCMEAGHPVPDENSFRATAEAIDLVKDLTAQDTVLFLLSGGGSALFERPVIEPEELQDITNQLLACGADIVEINTIRKRLSYVKGGRFAKICEPAQVFAIVLSDILGDPLDMIASGPVTLDTSTCEDAIRIIEKYKLRVSEKARLFIGTETPRSITNVTVQITGSVKQLCAAAAVQATALGYEPIILTDRMNCQAKEAGSFLASVLKTHENTEKPLAFIAGGETVVKLTGKGKGGRNQELALAAAAGLEGVVNAAIISVGSDGTDGPTDAAGGYADSDTVDVLRKAGISVYQALSNNDAYYALQAADGLIITGPTGTNVNDVTVGLIVPK